MKSQQNRIELVTRPEIFQTISSTECGAGGGGCFILVHQKNCVVDYSVMEKTIEKYNMRILDFKIDTPIYK